MRKWISFIQRFKAKAALERGSALPKAAWNFDAHRGLYLSDAPEPTVQVRSKFHAAFGRERGAKMARFGRLVKTPLRTGSDRCVVAIKFDNRH